MNTKTIIKNLPVFILLALFTACGKDNYEEPKSLLKGKIVYNGESVNVRGTDEKVRLQLYQYGYEKLNPPIEVFVTQDGSFSAMLFDGRYYAVTRDGNGPWVNSRDTTVVDVRGNTTMEFSVKPYFTISNANILLSGNTMNTSFTITKIHDVSKVERIILLLNNTTFVDDGFNILRKDITGGDIKTGSVNYSAELNDAAKNTKTLFGRVCVWPEGADQGIYSPVVKLK